MSSTSSSSPSSSITSSCSSRTPRPTRRPSACVLIGALYLLTVWGRLERLQPHHPVLHQLPDHRRHRPLPGRDPEVPDGHRLADLPQALRPPLLPGEARGPLPGHRLPVPEEDRGPDRHRKGDLPLDLRRPRGQGRRPPVQGPAGQRSSSRTRPSTTGPSSSKGDKIVSAGCLLPLPAAHRLSQSVPDPDPASGRHRAFGGDGRGRHRRLRGDGQRLAGHQGPARRFEDKDAMEKRLVDYLRDR